MGGSDSLSLKVILQAQDLASGIVKGFGSALSGLSGPAGFAASAALAVGTAVVGIGVQATKMAADYQQQMNMVQALTGSNAQQMSYYDTQVKQLAMDAGVAPTKLASGLYNVLSASYTGADAMKILTLATEDSKIGMTDAATTSNALTNVLRTFGTATSQATRVNGEMLETVTLGKSTFAQYASSITKAASTSKQFGQNMETMNAAWSTLTSTGISAGQATTDYDQLLGVMYSSIGTVSKSLNKNGIAFNEAKFNAMDFGDKVQYLNQVLTVANDKHIKITGATKQASQALQALASHTDMYNQNLKTLSNSQDMNNKTASAWAITQGGFNQVMSRLNATISVVMITIGQALLPVVTKLASSVIPIISRFGDWITKSGILQTISNGLTTGINLLGVGITNVAGFVTGLATGIGNLVGWFQKASPAALAVRDALIAVGIAIAIIKLGNFIATIPTLLAQMGLWLAATWAQVAALIAEAIAEMAANWPIYLIIAAILILIGIILLLVQHWGQVVSFLQGVWKGFTDWLGNSLHAIGQFFVGLWSGITTGVGNFFSMIGTLAHNGLMALLNAFLAPFRAIGELFSWLYNHNYYFKMLVDRIHAIIFLALAILQQKWQQFVGWLTGIWRGIVEFASKVWGNITTSIQTEVNLAWSILKAIWTTISTWLTNQWNQFANFATKAWQAVSGVFSSIWTKYISPPLVSLWNSISGWFGNLATQALQWGQNMITGFLNGVKNMFGSVGQTMGNLMSNVSKFLGFHSPAQQGEGQHIIEWGSNMLKGFGSGVNAAIPLLQAQVALAMKTSLQPMSPPALSGSIPYGQPPLSNSYSSSGGNHYGNNSIVINGAGQNPDQIARSVMQQLNQQYRRSGLMGNLSAGGRSS